MENKGIPTPVIVVLLLIIAYAGILIFVQPQPRVEKDAKVCITYEQSTGKCAKELTVGQIIADRIAEENK